MKKGIIFSIMTVMLMSTLVSLAGFYQKLSMDSDISSEKVRGIYSDITSDIKEIVGVTAEVGGEPGARTIMFKDTFPSPKTPDILNEYKTYLEGEYSNTLNTAIKIDATDPKFIILPTHMVYDYPTYAKNSIRVYNASGDAVGVDGYSIYISSDKNYVNTPEELTSGDLIVIVNASFPNGGHYSEYTLSRTRLSNITLNFTDAKIIISVGNNSISGQERNGSITVEKIGDLTAYVETEVLMPEQEYTGVMSLTAISLEGEINRKDNVWLTPQLNGDYTLPSQ